MSDATPEAKVLPFSSIHRIADKAASRKTGGQEGIKRAGIPYIVTNQSPLLLPPYTTTFESVMASRFSSRSPAV